MNAFIRGFLSVPFRDIRPGALSGSHLLHLIEKSPFRQERIFVQPRKKAGFHGFIRQKACVYPRSAAKKRVRFITCTRESAPRQILLLLHASAHDALRKMLLQEGINAHDGQQGQEDFRAVRAVRGGIGDDVLQVYRAVGYVRVDDDY